MPDNKRYTLTRAHSIGDDDLTVDTYVFDDDVTTVGEARALLECEGVATRGRRCQHSHDCCGNWYPGQVSFDVIGNMFIGKQEWRQNT